MKIKLSKAQWEFIGKQAKWIGESDASKTTKRVCPRCKGEKSVVEKIKNLGTLDYENHIIGCPMCNSKGYLDQEDHDSYLHSMGVKPCPFEQKNN